MKRMRKKVRCWESGILTICIYMETKSNVGQQTLGHLMYLYIHIYIIYLNKTKLTYKRSIKQISSPEQSRIKVISFRRQQNAASIAPTDQCFQWKCIRQLGPQRQPWTTTFHHCTLFASYLNANPVVRIVVGCNQFCPFFDAFVSSFRVKRQLLNWNGGSLERKNIVASFFRSF